MKEYFDQSNIESQKQLEILKNILGKDLFILKQEQAREKRKSMIEFLDELFTLSMEIINPLGLTLPNLKISLENEIIILREKGETEELDKKERDLRFIEEKIQSDLEKENRKPPLTYGDFEKADNGLDDQE